MDTLFIIPARGGSKGIPRKNIKELNGKSLIYYSIDVARQLSADDLICVSTDDDEIIEKVQEYGLKVPFKRPAELATDTAGTYEVLLHALNFYKEKGCKIDKVVVLQPTSPFRTAQHVKEALQIFTDDIDMVVSVKETKSNPYYVLAEENEDGFLEKSKKGDFVRRQDCPKVYEYNGAIYIISTASLICKEISKFKRTKKYVMTDISSLDIDNKLDWKIAECLLSENLDEF